MLWALDGREQERARGGLKPERTGRRLDHGSLPERSPSARMGPIFVGHAPVGDQLGGGDCAHCGP